MNDNRIEELEAKVDQQARIIAALLKFSHLEVFKECGTTYVRSNLPIYDLEDLFKKLRDFS